MRGLVVIPTYDERGNIERLAREIHEREPELHLLVVDDASPDGTGELADEMAARDPRIHVLHRPAKRGLGSAYVDGFRWALAHTEAPLVLQMDADFSHDPAALPEMLEAIRSCDLVVGSRYGRGTRILNWPVWRLALSVGANVYAAAVTGAPIRDLTAGFKCFRREALERLALDEIRSDGYGFQIETTVQAWQLGLRVREIPIVFHDRTFGRSKLSRRILWEAAWVVWPLRFRRARGAEAAPGHSRAPGGCDRLDT